MNLNERIKIIRHIDIPENIAEYIDRHDGVNLSFHINQADADSGYCHRTFYSVYIKRLTRTCNNCGYDPLWKPDDDESKCLRHTYNSWRYDTVFIWRPDGNHLSLEEAFDIWLKEQPTAWNQPVKKMIFGEVKW